MYSGVVVLVYWPRNEHLIVWYQLGSCHLGLLHAFTVNTVLLWFIFHHFAVYGYYSYTVQHAQICANGICL